MTIKFDVTVHVHMADMDEMRRIDNKVGYVISLLFDVLEAVVTDPAKLAAMRAKLDSAAAGLKEAVKTVS